MNNKIPHVPSVTTTTRILIIGVLAADIRVARERQFSCYSSLSSSSLNFVHLSWTSPLCYLLDIVQRRSMYGRTFLRVPIPRETRKISFLGRKSTRLAARNKQGGQWFLHSSATDHRGEQLSREPPTALSSSSESLRRLPSVTRHFSPLHDPRSVFPFGWTSLEGT